MGWQRVGTEGLDEGRTQVEEDDGVGDFGAEEDCQGDDEVDKGQPPGPAFENAAI